MKNIFTLLNVYIIKKSLFRVTFIILITFTVQAYAQSIIVISPNGGETWRNETEHTITWTHLGIIDSINIEISTDGGLSFTLLVGPISNTNSYLWTVPNLDEPDVRIKVIYAAEPDTNDISDANFRIISPNITSSPVKILPLGNSITSGTDVTPGLTTGDLASYRFKLWDLLRLDNYNIDFIGSEYFGYNIFPDYQNGGFGGTLIFDIKSILETGINPKFNPDDLITAPEKYLNVYTPDIILLDIGTNVAGSLTEATAISETNRLSQVLDDIFNPLYNPNSASTWVILAFVLNSADTTLSAYYQMLNDHIETMANNRINNGDRILIADMYNIPDFSYTVGGDLSDKIHPDSSGYAKMGQVWYNALDLIMPVGTSTPPLFSLIDIDTTAYLNIPFNYQAVASGVGAPIYSITSGPGTINQYSGKVNWTPNAVGDVSITITATNGIGSDVQNLTIHVLPQPNIPAELVAYWRFDENKESGPFTDSYNLNNGYAENLLSSTSGQVNSAYTFSGSNKVNVLDQPELDFVNTSFSVEAWVKRTSSSGDRAVVGKYGRTIDESYWWLGLNNSNQPTFYTSFDSRSVTRNTKQVTSSTSITSGSWNHVVGVKDNGTNDIKIYVNGGTPTTISLGTIVDTITSSHPLNIGHWYNANIFSGAIDEVAIYNDVLDDATILDHYKRGKYYGKGYFDNFLIVKTKIFLEGPYSTVNDSMNTILNPMVPTTSPYSEAETIADSIPYQVVDWVNVELRSTYNGATIDSKSGFLRKDGQVVSPNGKDNFLIMDAEPGNYYIVIKHRNHLAVMSSNTVSLTNDSTTTSFYDFTTDSLKFYGAELGTKKLEDGVWGMITGDVNGSGHISASDRIQVRTASGFGYLVEDLNLSGNVSASDRIIIRQAAGFSQVP